MSILSFKLEDLKNINWKDFSKRLYTKAFDEEEILGVSAQVAFYFAFALFPLLLFLVSIFGIVLGSAGDLRQEMFFYLQQVMPGSAYELVQKTITEVTEGSSGGKLTLGLVAALWSASAGVDSLRGALNGIYNLTETRAWWKAKLVSLSTTLGLVLLVTVALGVIFYGGNFISLILGSISLPVSSPFILGILQVIVILIVLVLVFFLIYQFLPNHKETKWVWVTPGAISGIILWLLLSYGFRLYLNYFNSYNKTYGSLGAVIILLLWLYLTALVIAIGGVVNAVLEEFTNKETAEAAANKAAAKEVVKNPDKDSATEKKAETLEKLDKGSDEKTTDRKDVKTNPPAEDDGAEKGPPEKSTLKLITGLVIGFVQNIRKR
ncbi:MAG: YihY/virulence factor BrkB family protein [Acidobacteriota bacterium]